MLWLAAGRGRGLGGAQLPGELVPQGFGQAKSAGLANSLRQLLVHHILVNRAGGGFGTEGGRDHCFARVLQNLPQQKRLKFLA